MTVLQLDKQYSNTNEKLYKHNAPSHEQSIASSNRSFTDITEIGVDYSIAFQPIVNSADKTVFGYEALVRGVNNESADYVLSHINESSRLQFDQSTKVKALNLAKNLGLQGMLSINISPSSVLKPEVCVPKTLEYASKLNFPTNRIMFEVTEREKITNNLLLREIFNEFKKYSITTAIDDFGAGFSGLNLLADWQPDMIKLDMSLTRNVNFDKVRRTLVQGIVLMCKEIGIEIIAEGIETKEEYLVLQDMGVNLFQGYMFAYPSYESLPAINNGIWTSGEIVLFNNK